MTRLHPDYNVCGLVWRIARGTAKLILFMAVPCVVCSVGVLVQAQIPPRRRWGPGILRTNPAV
jgi:hypothetical protein